jgi:hypothetical protein
MNNPDDLSYLRFTGPSQRDKAVHTLEGILVGMWIDGHFNPDEVKELHEWCSDNRRLIKRAPFDEIVPKLMSAIHDNRIDPEEYADIKWVVENSKVENEYFDAVTSDIQHLHGFLHGITADRQIKKEELEGLHDWILSREYLKGLYPYDEIESLIVATLRDGKIDPEEHTALLAYFNDFISYSVSKRVTRAIAISRGESAPIISRAGICAVDPDISVRDRVFVFTGLSERSTRKEIGEKIAIHGGELVETLTNSHYLIVGNMGNPAWAFACYGRKVEKAMQMRKAGKKIVIANELDLWDAIST